MNAAVEQGAGRKPRPVFSGPGSFGLEREPDLLYLVNPQPDGPFDPGGRPYHPKENCIVTGGRVVHRCLDCDKPIATRLEAIAHSALQGHFVTSILQRVIGPVHTDDDPANWEDHHGISLAEQFPQDHYEEYGACFD